MRDVDGDGEFTEKEVFFFSKDHLNSVHDLTDSQGKPVQRYNYTAYGKTKIEKTNLDRDAKLVNNPFAYTSREWEQESGDYYYRARYYDPRAGRFLSEDPIGFAGGDENFYRYVKNSPIRFGDPFGLATYSCSYDILLGLTTHDYLCVDGICDGLGPGESDTKVGALIPQPGGSSGGPSPSEGGDCEKKSDSKCVDDCVLGVLVKKKPEYNVWSGSQCQSYANKVLNYCVSGCKAVE